MPVRRVDASWKILDHRRAIKDGSSVVRVTSIERELSMKYLIDDTWLVLHKPQASHSIVRRGMEY